MNEIAKKATADRFLFAIRKKGLTKTKAGANIGLASAQVSCLFNEKYWDSVGTPTWAKVLAWANSGWSLTEFPLHRVVKPVDDAKKANVVPEPIKTVDIGKGLGKTTIIKAKEPEKKLSHGQMVDLLLEEKASLQAKIEAIDVLLKHYIS